MKDLTRVSPLVTAALLAMSLTPAALADKDNYNCGNLNQPKCNGGDFEYANIVAGELHKCEVDLTEVDGYCRNNKRITTTTSRNEWYKWALSEQSHGIGRNTPINFITWPASHNAYASEASGFGSGNYTNQRVSITDQLNLGIRHLELDPKYYPAPLSADFAIRLCHAYSVELCGAPAFQNRLFGFALTEIAQWIDANPGQVVYIKLDNIDLGVNITKVHQEIAQYLGGRVYQVPLPQAAVWPTIADIRRVGKSVIVAQHNANTPEIISPLVFNAVGLVQSDNHPKDQNFDTCIAHDGKNPVQRGAFARSTWWDTAEGRTKLNKGDKDTGLYTNDNVAKAANCGVAVIGLDFIDGLYSSYNISPSNEADTRLKHMVWSWTEGDFGNRGPAYQNPANGRWVSASSSNVLPVACAIRNPGTRQDRGWQVTNAAIPWNKALGDAKCVEEFGASYEFAYPVNGYQNRDLKNLAGGRTAWLGYSRVSTPNVSVSSTSLVFRMDPTGPPPATQSIRISAAPGTTLGATAFGNVPLNYQLPANALATGEYNLVVGIGSAAGSLPPGTYTGGIDVSFYPPGSVPGSANQEIQPVVFNITLVVRANSALSAYADPVTARQGAPVSLRATFTAGISPAGGIKFYRIRDANGRSTGQETVATGTATGIDGVKVEVSNLPLGTNTYVASYIGDEINLGSVSEPFTFTATPRILANPASVLMTRQAGSSIRPKPNVALSNLATGPAANHNCPWLEMAFFQSTLTLSVTDAAMTYAVGSYPCNVTITDSLTNQGLGSTVLPVEYRVQTSLSATPSPVSLSTFTATQTDVQVQAAGGASIPLSVSADRPWILTELNTLQTPATLRVSIDTQSLPTGISTGSVTVQSTLASPLTIPVTFQKVAPTTITSTPAGRTVIVDGSPVTTPATFTWQPNTNHSLSAIPQIVNGTRYTPVIWQFGAAASLGSSTTAIADANGGTYTAGFETAYRLTTTSVPANGGGVSATPNSADGFYAPGTPVLLNATPSTNWSFTGWTGDLTSVNPQQTLVMSGPRSAIAGFSQSQQINAYITSNAPGATATVNGTSYTLPASLRWTPGQVVAISAPGLVTQTISTRWSFANFTSSTPINNGSLVVPQTDVDVRLNYTRQFLLTASSSPVEGGTVTGAGWYNEGTAVVVQAVPNTGYGLISFTGDFAGVTENPMTVIMAGPRNAVANFKVTGQPALVATVLARIAGPGPNQRTVPIQIRNTGTAMAPGTSLTGITGIVVLSGSGSVTVATPAPIGYGDIPAGGGATQNVVFDWPATAIRVSFTANYTTAIGRPGSTTFTVFR